MSSLREQLAVRLRLSALMTAPPMMTKDSWERVVDECIRQMEWARHDAMREFVTDDAKEVRSMVARHNLTAAPEDWKP